MKQAVTLAFFLVALQCVSITSTHHHGGVVAPAPVSAGAFNCHTPHLILKFSYCARDNVAFDSASFYVGWNGATVFDYTPEDYQIHYVTIELNARVGQNTLNFAGTGTSDGLGMTIDNVRLLKDCGCFSQDLIANGEFHDAVWVDQGWKYFYEGVRGWKGKEIEIGNGRHYNKRLLPNNPVTELDASCNVDIIQTIYLDDKYRKIFYYFGAPSVLA